MRYYRIIISGAPPVFPVVDPATGAQWSSIINGQHDPNAQQVEFQIEEWTPNGSAPSENSVLTIYGVSFDQIKQSANLVGCPITIYGGMSPGLPLATFQARNAGLLMQAKIIKCWGNWIGTDTSIGMAFSPVGDTKDSGGGGGNGGGGSAGGGGGGDGGGGNAGGQSIRLTRTGFRSIDRRTFPRVSNPSSGLPIVAPKSVGGDLEFGGGWASASQTIGGITASFFGGGSISPLQTPLNIIHNLQANMPLSSAIQETLSRVFPSANINMLISPALKLAYQDAGMYQGMEQYTQYIKKLSNSILGTTNYGGVNFSAATSTIDVWDGTSPVSTGDISYLDLIGQPTWIAPTTISIKVVMRSITGLRVGSYVTLPPTLMAVSGPDAMVGGGAVPDQRKNISFTGVFLITKVLHIGDFRNPDGASWSTNYEAVIQAATTGANDISQQVTQGQ